MSDRPPDKPFGTYALPAPREWLRRQGNRVPDGKVGHLAASLVRRLAVGSSPGPFDVEIFPTVRARLYPKTNRCEKRVITAAQFFDGDERRSVADFITKAADGRIVFVDLGANVGLYGLSALSDARRLGRALRVVAVEADPDTRERLRHNIEFSGAADNFTVVAAGVGAERGQGTIQTHDRNRGEHRVVPAAAGSPAAGRGKTVPIEIIPLLDICRAEGVDRIDILKIDVEGFDYDVLRAFFATASRSLFPGMIIVEAGRDQGTSPVVELVQTNGYRLAERTRLNAILVAPDQSDKQG